MSKLRVERAKRANSKIHQFKEETPLCVMILVPTSDC